MIAEVISIGDELTSGQRLDTNSRWLSEQLGELGITVMYHTTVGDDLLANAGVFRAAIERADVVVVTGGLGPTADDLTREAMALATETKLVLDPQQLEHIRNLFARRGREMPERNRLQAMFPTGSRPIFNPNGSAPGVEMVIDRGDDSGGRDPCRLFALPGVPAEMFEMWWQSVAPAIGQLMPESRVIRHRRIKCFGVGESHLEQMLPELIHRDRQPRVGITVSQATITLRITASGRTHDECLAAMLPTEQTIRQTLAELVFGEEDEELQHVVARLLQARQRTLATVEWGTVGLVAQWLSEVCATDKHYGEHYGDHCEDHYRGGLTIASGKTLQTMLGLKMPHDASDRPDHDALTARMAESARERFGSDLGLAVGPLTPGDAEAKIADHFTIALATGESVITQRASLAGHPEIVLSRAAKQALDLVRRSLLEVSTD